jgi:hypothetical protein
MVILPYRPRTEAASMFFNRNPLAFSFIVAMNACLFMTDDGGIVAWINGWRCALPALVCGLIGEVIIFAGQKALLAYKQKRTDINEHYQSPNP